MENKMKKYAQVLNQKVINVLLWDGKEVFDLEGELVELPIDSLAGIDWDYIDEEFLDNRPVQILS
jgi:hypothetical protein